MENSYRLSGFVRKKISNKRRQLSCRESCRAAAFLLIFYVNFTKKEKQIYNEGLYSTKEGQKRNAKGSIFFGTYNVIQHLDVTIQDGSFTVLVGPSGCGKTTLLRMIAGIGSQSDGQILIDGKDMTDVAPGQRDVAMVFQNYAIYPTMSVYGNIEDVTEQMNTMNEEAKATLTDLQ